MNEPTAETCCEFCGRPVVRYRDGRFGVWCGRHANQQAAAWWLSFRRSGLEAQVVKCGTFKSVRGDT